MLYYTGYGINIQDVSRLRFIRNLIRRIVGFLLLLAVIFGIVYLLPITEGTDMTGMDEDAGWMSRLPDQKKLNEITLAGTHASCTQFVQLPYLFKCQGDDVSSQLKAGFRYLDIGLGIEKTDGGDRLKVMTGFADCIREALPNSENVYLENVLSQCYSFLEQQPTETILFAVNYEHGSDSVSAFENLLYAYLVRDYDRWLLTDQIPTLGECRGRIVLLRRFEDSAGLGSAAGIPLVWEDQSGGESKTLNAAAVSNGAYQLYVQDRKGYNDEEKWQAFVNGMAVGGREIANGSISLNFLSSNGVFFFGHPYHHASKLNGFLRNRGAELKGWIIVDFGEPYLARLAYRSNADLSDQPVVAPAGETDRQEPSTEG